MFEVKDRLLSRVTPRFLAVRVGETTEVPMLIVSGTLFSRKKKLFSLVKVELELVSRHPLRDGC